jgi:nucleotide-binding universal stress UspA family protein
LRHASPRRGEHALHDGIASLKDKGFSCTGHLAVGEPVEEIGRMATELGCDLIIVGHKQHASLARRWWQGSVSKSLLDYAPCSVLIAVTK